MTSPVMLQHVLVNGQLRNVREFRGLSVQDRPVSTCPECKERVTLRLGLKRRAHAAHRNGAICPTTQGETALHRAVKFHIARELQGRRFVTAKAHCVGEGNFAFVVPNNCDRTTTWNFAKNWTRVELEYAFEGIRPDIVLINGERIVGAIEIAVHHFTGDDKANRYLELEIPWIEVVATPEMISQDNPWSIRKPLPVLWDEEGFEWRCEQCSIQRGINIVEARDAEVLAWRIVDFYYESGKCWRDRFEIRKVYDGQQAAAVMACKASDPADWNHIYPEPDEYSAMAIQNEVEAYWGILKGQGVIVDSPMTWVESSNPEEARDFKAFPRRYRNVVGTNAWFLPAINKQLTWPVIG